MPSRVWKAGDTRSSPRGEPLEGAYDSSYYCCDLPIPESTDLAQWIDRAIAFLRPIRKQLVSFVDEGGTLSFYVGLEKGAFEGTSLKPELLAELGAFRMSLDIDRAL